MDANMLAEIDPMGEMMGWMNDIKAMLEAQNAQVAG
jgi:hypothetical protein